MHDPGMDHLIMDQTSGDVWSLRLRAQSCMPSLKPNVITDAFPVFLLISLKDCNVLL